LAKLNKTDLTLRFKRGLLASLNLALTALLGRQGEPFYTTDTKQLFIHDGTSISPVQSLDMALTYENEIVIHNGDVVYTF